MTHVRCCYIDTVPAILLPSDSLPLKPHITHVIAGYEPVYLGVWVLIANHNILLAKLHSIP
jgi:hypothetical protein